MMQIQAGPAAAQARWQTMSVRHWSKRVRNHYLTQTQMSKGIYSEKEVNNFQVAFRDVIRRQRIIGTVTKAWFIGFFVILFTLWLLDALGWKTTDKLMYLVLIYFGLGWLFTLFGSCSEFSQCPACHRDVFDIKHFCPECSRSLEPKRWYQDYSCKACGKALTGRKSGRNFKIKACTHCGIILTDEGL